MNDGRWTFFKAGGFDQVKLTSGADLMRLGELDQKLWVALACPTSGLELDARTLALIDTDKDGRVRAPELIAATSFAGRNLKNPDHLLEGAGTLALAAINDDEPEGKTLLSSARQILANIGKADATSISIDDVADPTRVFLDSAFNGDGVVTELSTPDAALKAVIGEIVACLGSEPDRSGKVGVTLEKIDAFFGDATAFSAWYAAGEADATNVFPLGTDATVAAVNAIAAIRAKVDDYFARCRVVAYDPRAAAAVNRKEEEYLDLAAQDLTITASEIAGFPLSMVAGERPLPLQGAVNPAHAAALAVLRDAAVKPLLGPRAQLVEADWTALVAKIGAYEKWLATKAGARVESLGLARVRAILSTNAREALTALVAQDNALEAEAASIENVERLVRYNRDLAVLCTNFVNFKDFYDGDRQPAIFQAGTLYLDQRSCTLCLKVEDAGKHATMAGLAGVYLAYLDCARKGSDQKMTIVAAFTAGDSDNLMVGRNGIFYDRKGQDWDATITKIVENPISIRQAFWSPYKKFVRMLEEQVAKRAAVSDASSNDMLSATATHTAHVGAAKPPETKKIDVGTVAALGVAVGAIGTFITAMLAFGAGVFKLGPLAVAGAIAGLMLLISLPSVVMAFLKLRKRNMGPILDANGWAVNAKAKINIPFGRTLTEVAKLPPGSKHDLHDPYAEAGFPLKTLIAIVLLVLVAYEWYEGVFDRLLPPVARSTEILGTWAPRSTPSAPSGPDVPAVAAPA
ncbi:MAG: hypothetical protein JWM82_3628, partial [Myxococcales bacterium]|nr:hypothetical protein [Myxococcales bacterium]